MTDYRQEQKDELEAIESIYSEEIDILNDNPTRFTIPVKTDEFDDEQTDEGMWVLLKFTYPDTYPDVGVEIEFEESEGIEDEQLGGLREHLNEVVEENLGMAMVFSIVSAAIEWLGETNDRLKFEADEVIRIKKEKDDEEERKKLEGTKVTIESFLAWKDEFDAEMNAKKSAAVLSKKEKEKMKKNGRELFMTDQSLIQSDVKFLAEAGDVAITVDESLFEDMEDLDLDEEEESDDPDWKAGAGDSD
eukprot:TRINITY_DN67096_c0_g1_i1.p1 TRINITY_DN67096_c0_g1~~TRINITY_DN67096_c0_g1_i1.p1  ORF type:complete len:247 (+),score=106.38 TRINITY_DN67096_c0_g1_i1:34-774(+)